MTKPSKYDQKKIKESIKSDREYMTKMYYSLLAQQNMILEQDKTLLTIANITLEERSELLPCPTESATFTYAQSVIKGYEERYGKPES